MTFIKIKSLKNLPPWADTSPINRFKTISQAIKYLDAKYGRKQWVDGEPNELMYVGGLSVYVQYGLRVDPDDTQFSKYKQWEAKYPELKVRLS